MIKGDIVNKIPNKLTPEQVEQLRVYFATLDKIRGYTPNPDLFTYDELEGMVPIYGLIEKFGNGDPIIAAANHAIALADLHDENHSQEG